jgi:alkylation response protein AidB-like acyl-CoA dehydrogenase
MDFAIPADLLAYLAELDAFIAAEIKPLEQQDDNIRFFDHRREHARTDWEAGGLPRHEWEELLKEATRRSDRAGHWRFSAPKRYGGKDGSNLWMVKSGPLQHSGCTRPSPWPIGERGAQARRRSRPCRPSGKRS